MARPASSVVTIEGANTRYTNPSAIGPRLGGSVRTRASQCRLKWDETNPGSCGLQDGQHGHTPPEVEQSAAIGENMLMVAGAEAEEVAQFIVSPAEPGGRSRAFEAPHGSIAAFDAPVVLLQPVV